MPTLLLACGFAHLSSNAPSTCTDDDTFIARGKNGGSICIIKVVDATKMYANPCCCTTETEEGACLIWSRTAKGAPDNAEIER